jgi:hypothetical protein
MMWKNVRGIISMTMVLAYIAFTGWEVYNSKVIPDHFYSTATMVIGFYFIQRSVEGNVK